MITLLLTALLFAVSPLPSTTATPADAPPTTSVAADSIEPLCI